MRNFKDIGKDLRELLGRRVLVLDGAMGTMLQQRDLTAADFGGAALEGCNEVLVRTRPDVVLDIHRAYFAAGADIVETNSFGGTPLVLAEYWLDAEAHGLNKKAAELAPEAAKGLVEGGADLLLVEPCQDTRNIKAALLAIEKLSQEIGSQVPVIVSVTIEPMGTMLAGQTVDAMWASLRHAKPLAFGMNCATGPAFMTDHIRTLSAATGEFVSWYPN